MLKTRIITALILASIFVSAIFFLPPLFWNVLVLFVVALAAVEWAKLSKFSNRLTFVYAGLIGLVGLLSIFIRPEWLNIGIFFGIFIAALFWVLIAPLILWLKKPIQNQLLLSLLGLAIILPFGLAMIALRAIGPWLLIVFILAVSIADSAAYFAGTKFGKRKLAPSISPGKTWEGVVGALVAISIYGFILCQITHQSLWFIVVLWALTILSVEGDLLESFFKRQAEVKDSGTILPGHGGVLDRIDGLTSSLPLMTFLIALPTYLSILTHG